MNFRSSLYMSLPLLASLVSVGCGSDSESSQVEAPATKIETILAILAHPDDEMMASPLLARYAREGATVHLAAVTDGRWGDSNNTLSPEDLITTRAAEAQCSTAALGLEAPILLGYEDGESMENIYTIKADIAALIAEIEPDVLITWGPEGGYGHKDHKIVSSIVSDVFQAGSPDGSAWPASLYYPAFPKDKLKEDFSPTSPYGYTLQAIWGTTEYDYLEYTITFNDEDKAASKAAASCHTSQWNEATLVDIHQMVDVAEYEVLLRKALHKAQGKTRLD